MAIEAPRGNAFLALGFVVGEGAFRQPPVVAGRAVEGGHELQVAQNNIDLPGLFGELVEQFGNHFRLLRPRGGQAHTPQRIIHRNTAAVYERSRTQ